MLYIKAFVKISIVVSVVRKNQKPPEESHWYV